jgi:Domain of unknown function (DUF4396)
MSADARGHHHTNAVSRDPVHQPQVSSASLNRVAFSATVHCLAGCAVGEVLGMVIGTTLDWSAHRTVVLAIVLAFVFGYAFTMAPLLKAGLMFGVVLKLALAADTTSIAIMEIVDNAIMLAVPGAMEASATSPLFWGSLGSALLIAGVVAFPVNRWLITRGKGHAIVHRHPHQQH